MAIKCTAPGEATEKYQGLNVTAINQLPGYFFFFLNTFLHPTKPTDVLDSAYMDQYNLDVP